MNKIIKTIKYKDGVLIVNGTKCKFLAESSRKVFKYKNFVIKIDNKGEYDLDEETQNKTEYVLWKKLSSYDKRYFAKTHEFGEIKNSPYSYLVQDYISDWAPYVDDHKDDHDEFKLNHGRVVDRLQSKYKLWDLSGRNCGKAKDRFWIVDFGC